MTHSKKASFLLLLFLFLLSGCFEQDSKRENSSLSFHQKNSIRSFAMADGMAMRETSSGAATMALDRSKLGKDRRVAESHRLEVEIEQNSLRARVQSDFNRCVSMQCEVLNSNSNKNNAHLAIRIIPEQLPAFLQALEEGEGEIVSHNVSVDDRTMAYIDTAANLRNKEALRARLTKLLESDAARNVSELLKIERELSRVQSEIESATGQMRFLESETAKARVDVSYEVPVYARDIDYRVLKGSLTKAWRGFISSVSEVIVFVGQAAPWLPVFLLGLWLFVRVLKASIFSSGWKMWRKKTQKERDS